MLGRGSRVAVVGCGYWGKNLVRNFHELGALEAMCDLNEACLQELGKEYRVRATRNFDDVLAMPEIHGIVAGAPPDVTLTTCDFASVCGVTIGEYIAAQSAGGLRGSKGRRRSVPN